MGRLDTVQGRGAKLRERLVHRRDGAARWGQRDKGGVGRGAGGGPRRRQLARLLLGSLGSAGQVQTGAGTGGVDNTITGHDSAGRIGIQYSFWDIGSLF